MKNNMSLEKASILFTKALFLKFLSLVSKISFLVFSSISCKQQFRILSSPQSAGIICFSIPLWPNRNRSFMLKHSSIKVMARRASLETLSPCDFNLSNSTKTIYGRYIVAFPISMLRDKNKVLLNDPFF